MNEFQNKVAIVTGSTSGIGRAAAVAYARAPALRTRASPDTK
jgi:NAD(P)-dependent dehydrogenase (short-subunit alcohol dehydrogenase family)